MKRSKWPELYGKTKTEKLYNFITGDGDVRGMIDAAVRAVKRTKAKGTLKYPESPFVIIAKAEKERLHRILVAEKRKKERLPRFSKEDYISVARMLTKRYL